MLLVAGPLDTIRPRRQFCIMNDDHPRRATRAQRLLMLASFAASILASAGLATCAKAAELSGTATVIDGDDLMLATEHGPQRVRLYGIDAFETKQTCTRDGATWACGAAATSALEALIAGKTVVCDGNARSLLSLWRVKRRCVADGIDLGGRLVSLGLAVSRHPQYDAVHETARAGGVGAWTGCFRDPSWFRSKVKREMGNGCQ